MFPTTSLDLIFNFPTQTEKMLLNDLKTAKKLGVKQIITYPLMKSKLRNMDIFSQFKLLKIVESINFIY